MAFNFGGGGNTGSGFSFGGNTGTNQSAGFGKGTATTTAGSNIFSGGGGGFSFGQKTTTSTAPSASSLFSTGGGGGSGSFSFGQPANNAQQQTAQQSSGFSFGGTGGFSSLGSTTPASTTQATQQQSSGLTFGGLKSGFGTQSTVSSTTSAGGIGAGFTFNKPASAATLPGSQSTPSFGLGGGGLTGGSKPFSQGSVAPGTTAGGLSSGGFQFGGAQAVPGTTSMPGEIKLGMSASSQRTAVPQLTTATSAPSSGGLTFGTPKSTAGFSLGGSFGQVSSSQTPSNGITLGHPAPQATTAASTTTTTNSAPSFGFGIGSKLTTTSVTTSSAAPAPAGGGFSLSGKIASTPASLSSLGATTSATTSTTSGFQLGGGFSTATSTAPTTTKGFSLGAASTSSTSSTAATTTTSSTPSLRYCDLESKVNTWMAELEQQEKLFLTQATHVNAWNKLLIENADKITVLNDEFENVELNQKRLNEELDYIKTQQGELEDLLKPLEESTKQQLSSLSSSVHTHHADIERERTYNLAENIDSQLKNMVQDLREVVDHINSTSAPSDSNNPIVQIGKILSAHMDSLQWLDSNSVALQHKVQDMSKQVDQMKKEHESKFRLAFN